MPVVGCEVHFDVLLHDGGFAHTFGPFNGDKPERPVDLLHEASHEFHGNNGEVFVVTSK